jgi:outer membrane protein assembly factor BamB/Ethanolamine utilization protein EutJ (predicted chaperonin)
VQEGTSQASGFAVGVDLGTSNTVAVVRWPDGRTRPLLVDGAPITPSGVLLDEHGRLHVGRDAQRMALLDPARFEPNPKRHIDEDAVLLGDREVLVVDLLAAVLGAVARVTVETVGFLPPAALTYPAAWGQPRRDKLVAAAGRAGWPPVHLVPEPVAAARYFADVLRRPVPFGSSLAVFDFGGGTLDIAVVRNDGGRFAVLGTGGIPDLGGLDIDAALVEHLGGVLRDSMPDAWRGLASPDTISLRRNRRLFWEDVRGAKEMLSRSTVAPVAVPDVDRAVHLTREELERVASPLLRRAVYETGAVIARCGLRPDQLAGLFLVGGSSRLPLVARLLHAELGIAPTVLEQPELPVAEGALVEVAPPPTSAALAPDGYAPAVGPIPPAPVSPVPASPVPAAAAPQAPVSPGHRPWFARRLVWATAVAGLAVLTALAVAAYLGLRSSVRPVDFATMAQTGTLPTGLQGGDLVDMSVAVSGDTGYLAWQHSDTLEVAAVDLGNGHERWRHAVEGSSKQWEDIVVLPGAIMAEAKEYSSKPHGLYVLDPASGTQLWTRDVYNQDWYLPVGDKLVLVSPHDHTVRGLDRRTGNQKWQLDDPKDRYGNQVDTIVFDTTTAKDLTGTASFSGYPTEPDLGDDRRLLQITYDKTLNVIDADTGTVTKHRQGVGGTYDYYRAHEGRLYVVTRTDGYRVQSYDLDKLGEPTVVYTAPDSKHSEVDIEPCGDGRLCVLDETSSDAKTAQVLAIDPASHKVVWQRDAPGTKLLVPVGDRILATNTDSTPASRLFDPDGKQLLGNEEQNALGVRVNAGSLIFFADQPTSYSADNSLFGVTAGSGAHIALGPLAKTRSRACAWTQRYIVCARNDDFAIWRFTR